MAAAAVAVALPGVAMLAGASLGSAGSALAYVLAAVLIWLGGMNAVRRRLADDRQATDRRAGARDRSYQADDGRTGPDDRRRDRYDGDDLDRAYPGSGYRDEPGYDGAPATGPAGGSATRTPTSAIRRSPRSRRSARSRTTRPGGTARLAGTGSPRGSIRAGRTTQGSAIPVAMTLRDPDPAALAQASSARDSGSGQFDSGQLGSGQFDDSALFGPAPARLTRTDRGTGRTRFAGRRRPPSPRRACSARSRSTR